MLFGSPARDAVAVNGDDAVARTQSGLESRTSDERFGNVDVAVALHNQRAYAGILSGGHALEGILLVLGDVFSVRVDVIEHSVDGCSDGLRCVDGVDVESLQLFVEGVEDVEVARYFRFIGTRCGSGNQRQSYYSCGKCENLLHLTCSMWVRWL